MQRERALEPRLERRQCETARHNRTCALGRRGTRHDVATAPSSGGRRQPPGPLGKKIKDIMENAVDLEVPNKVDYESGPNWGEIK